MVVVVAVVVAVVVVTTVPTSTTMISKATTSITSIAISLPKKRASKEAGQFSTERSVMISEDAGRVSN